MILQKAVGIFGNFLCGVRSQCLCWGVLKRVGSVRWEGFDMGFGVGGECVRVRAVVRGIGEGVRERGWSEVVCV